MLQRLARALVPLLLPVAVLASAAASHAAYPGSNGRIAFVREVKLPSDQPDQVFTMGPDGANPAPFTADAAHESFKPVWSPSGSRLAYVQNTSAGNPPFTLYVANADGSGIRPVASDSSFLGNPSW